MLRLNFTEEDIQELDYHRYHHPHPRVQRKMEALLLKARGLPHHQIAMCVGVCENTLRSYLEQYQMGGIEALKRLEFYQPTSELESHHETLEAYFKAHPPASIPEAVKRIEELDFPQTESDTGRDLSQKTRSEALKNGCGPRQV